MSVTMCDDAVSFFRSGGGRAADRTRGEVVSARLCGRQEYLYTRTNLGHLVLKRRKNHGKDGLAIVLKE